MEQVIVSSDGQITIPESVCDDLNLSEGSKLILEVRGHTIVLSKDPAWKKMRGMAPETIDGRDTMAAFADLRKQDRAEEDRA